MSVLSIEELKAVATTPKNPCVSIFMPTHKAGPDIRQDPIRFKNLMKQAEERLIEDENGLDHTDAVRLLEPARDLDHEDFWRHQDTGLALFIAPGFFRYYRMPLEFEEVVVVSDRFHLKPLLPLLNGDGRFYLLDLSQEGIKLFEGSRYSIKEVDLENVPPSLSEALQYDWQDKGIQNRINTSRGGTSNPFQRGGSSHGQGSPETDDNRQQILQYFHIVDKGVFDYLNGEQAPLVIAGVEYLFPIYREANTYPHLLEEGITGNQKISTPEELHEQAWAIVEPHFLQAEQDATERYREFSGNNQDQVSDDLKEVVKAAYYQRIDSLFVAVGQQQWGSFDPQSNTVQLHEQEQPGDEDLLDFAAIHTILNGGTVFAVQSDRVPAQSLVAAIFRY
ncbi:MAG: hypothetical protein AB1589_01470 [Cyanobacteriota bacterium]